MDIVSYVNKVGKILNDDTKYSVNLNRTSIKNLILIDHLDKLLNWAKTNIDSDNVTDEDISLIEQFILCLKKEISVYPEMIIDDNCILTETSKNIIQE